MIDWTARAAASAIFPAPAMRDSARWTSDFWSRWAAAGQEANPNGKMKIKLPTVVKAGPVIPSLRHMDRKA